MAEFELVMPKMGESIMEATILKWLKNAGDPVEEDETILEIATDKVDSEIPSPIQGVIKKVLYPEDAIVAVGETIALISTETGEDLDEDPSEYHGATDDAVVDQQVDSGVSEIPGDALYQKRRVLPAQHQGRFYSPLVRSIAGKEGLSLSELNTITGTGLHGRVTKRDLMAHLSSRDGISAGDTTPAPQDTPVVPMREPLNVGTASVAGEDEVIQMDRMRKLIADHMVMSKKISPHVTSFVEADVTDMVAWRNRNKDSYTNQYGGKLTFTPIIIHAIARAIRDFPLVNVSVNEDQIIVKKAINIGMATALPSGNLIVPVIKHADNYSITGLARKVNDLAERARVGELQPDETQDGTFTFTNVGTFGNTMGTPIINQPQVAILAAGSIKKKPAVVETEYGDLIAVRQMVFLSLSYDHRVVDGSLGGSFLRRIADYLEQFQDDHS